MKTVSRETALRRPIHNNDFWDNHRIEYTPHKLREPQAEDRILIVASPRSNLLEILTKMDAKDYNIEEKLEEYHVTINLSMFPKLEEIKILEAARQDDQDETAWMVVTLGALEAPNEWKMYELPSITTGNIQSVRKENT